MIDERSAVTKPAAPAREDRRLVYLRDRFEGSAVRERLGPSTTSVDVRVEDDGLIAVQWPSGKVTIHTEDELEVVPQASDTPRRAPSLRSPRAALAERRDPFSAVRRYLPKPAGSTDGI